MKVTTASKLAQIYADGALLKSATVSAPTNNALNRINLGDLRVGRGCYWKGRLVSVRVYNRVLTAEEIAHNAHVDQLKGESMSSASVASDAATISLLSLGTEEEVTTTEETSSHTHFPGNAPVLPTLED